MKNIPQEKCTEFETSVLAKEKRFPQWKDLPAGYPYAGSWDIYNDGTHELNGCSEAAAECIVAPFQSILQTWLRELNSIEIVIHPKIHHILGKMYTFDVFFSDQVEHISYNGVNTLYTSHEKALEVGLLEALKLIKS